jgi:hypothetical protein
MGLLFLGVGTVLFSHIEWRKLTEFTVEKSWNLAANLTEKKTYRLIIESAEEWGELFSQGLFDEPQPVNLTITSPNNNVTKIRTKFYGLPPTNPLYKEGQPPTIVDVYYDTIDGSSLEIIPSTSEIQFTVKKGGNYTVQILQEGLAAREPPDEMCFAERVFESENVYRFSTLSGGSLCVIGCFISLWGYAGKSRVKRKKKLM